MAYTKQTWADLPEETTPINAARLTHMEDGIYEANKLATQTTPGQMSSTDKSKLDVLNEPEVVGETLIL